MNNGDLFLQNIPDTEVPDEREFGDYRLQHAAAYSFWKIERKDDKPLHKRLEGMWTGIEAAKDAIRAVEGKAIDNH